VGTQSIVGQDGQFKVKRDDKVRFINLTTQVVNIELDFMYPDHTADVKEFSLEPGKSKRIKIKENLPEGGTTINIRWGVAAPPPSGGPNMIVEP